MDYAINCGDGDNNEVDYTGSAPDGAGPRSSNPPSLDAIEEAFRWCLSPSGKVIGVAGCSDPATGISFSRSEVATKHITDGTSKTYLIGEKFMSPQFYETGTDRGDNETWCTGYNNDNFRTTRYVPLQDRDGFDGKFIFGSTHPGGFHMSFCDGHVEPVAYDIDSRLHRSYGNRRDGSVAGEIWP
jgi:prepilin-type processing-associated H-X9-DG protein